MLRAVLTLTLVLALVGFSGTVHAALYKYTDDKGVLHIVTSIDDVPEKYRDQVQKMKTDLTPTSSSATSPAPAPSVLDPGQTVGVGPDGLARFEIPYENEGSTRRIIIPVNFNDRLTVPMALDTGAPGMVISLDLAIRLGIFQRDSGTLVTAAGGIGGVTPAILTIIDSVAVESARSEFIPTTVTLDSLSGAFDGLIGMDFLTNYNLTVDTRRQVVVFQETEPLPGTRGGHDETWWRDTFEAFRAMSDGWRNYVKSVNRDSQRRISPFAEFQAREADRLLQRLHLYASAHAVPRHWR